MVKFTEIKETYNIVEFKSDLFSTGFRTVIQDCSYQHNKFMLILTV